MKKIEINNETRLYLVGFRVDAENENGCDFYTLYIDDERPIDINGWPILFFDIQKASKALEVSDCGCQGLDVPTFEIYAFMDIADAVYSITEKNILSTSNTLDCLNTLLDFLAMLPDERVQPHYKEIMREAANYFTFSLDIKSYFEESKISRVELIQAIEWAVGAIVLYAKFIY